MTTFFSFSFFGRNEDARVAALTRFGHIIKEPMILRNLIGKPVKYIETLKPQAVYKLQNTIILTVQLSSDPLNLVYFSLV